MDTIFLLLILSGITFFQNKLKNRWNNKRQPKWLYLYLVFSPIFLGAFILRILEERGMGIIEFTDINALILATAIFVVVFIMYNLKGNQ